MIIVEHFKYSITNLLSMVIIYAYLFPNIRLTCNID